MTQNQKGTTIGCNRKLRQEEHQVQEMTTEEMYKLEIAEMQKTIHYLQTRVKELNDAVLQLQEQKDR